MSDDTRTAMAARPVVYTTPLMAAVQPERLTYRCSTGETMPLDLYRPPANLSTPARPAVVLVTGYRDEGMRKVFGCAARETGAFESWATLLAATGLIAVTYENTNPVEDARAVFSHLRATGSGLAIDPTRLGVWSCSGHGPTALAMAMEEPGVACAALVYPYLLDLGTDTSVANAAAMFRFAAPAQGRTMAELPADRPILVARAGRDEMPGLNDSLDRFVAQALAANRPLTVVNHATGPHAFDLVDDTRDTHRVVRTVLHFLEASLHA